MTAVRRAKRPAPESPDPGPSASKVKCQYCPKLFDAKARGAQATHLNACKRRHDELEASEAYEKRCSKKEAKAKQRTHRELSAIAEVASSFRGPTLEEPSDTIAVDPYTQYMEITLTDPGFKVLENQPLGDEPLDDQPLDDPPLETMDNHFSDGLRSRSDSHSNSNESSSMADFGRVSPPPVSVNFSSTRSRGSPMEFKTEYQPKGRRAETTSYDSYDTFRSRSYVPEAKEDVKPWFPFRSRGDSEFASIALDANLSDSVVNRILSLMRDVVEKRKDVTFTNSQDLRKVCDEAAKEFTPFQEHPINLEHKKDEIELNFMGRDLWDWSLDLLHNEQLAPHFVWDAQRVYKHNGRLGPESNYVRFIDEPWTADRWWDIQDSLPQYPDAPSVPLAYVFYADKTRLSSAGNVQGYPIVARCANLPVDIRNGRGVGGGRVVGWLPLLPGDAEKDGTLSYTTLKRVVWHKSVAKLFEGAQHYSHTGYYFSDCFDGIPRWLFLVILILSADYEEQCVMALIRGAMGNFPCPVCLVPSDRQSRWAESYPRRSAGVAESLYADIKSGDRAKKKKARTQLQNEGWRPVENAFWLLRSSDPADAVTVDHLHAFHHGLYGKHIQPELIKILASFENSREYLGKLDKQFSQLPSWRGLAHFNAVSTVNFSDGNKFRDISRQMLFAAHNVIKRTQSPEFHVLLCVLSNYLEIDSYFGLEVQTDETLEALDKEVERYGKQLDVYIEVAKAARVRIEDIKILWDFPKNHAVLKHAVEDLRKKGVSRNSTTRINEGIHPPFKRSYYLRCSGKKVEKQILRIEDHRLAVYIIEERIQAQEKRLKARTSVSDHHDDWIGPEFEGHFHLGSPSSPQTVKDLVDSHRSSDRAFINFRKSLKVFINEVCLPDRGYAGPCIKVRDGFVVQGFRFVKVNYESVETWKMCTDLLRCTPSFYDKPRYDCAIVHLDADPDVFGIVRLVFPFKFTIPELGANCSPFHAVLVQPYTGVVDSDKGSRTRRTDTELGFLRVKAQPRSEAIVIPVASIIRGALLFPDFRRPDEFLVNDYIDGDMFLRMKDLKWIGLQ
ncbi:hypothetical protein CONPUDRAFT_157070 [Coniophora puteana RWD-64-598 SS2]|uniref:Uncharacterized protein n=1 Tax=Coniophora puteana (strain RWD-64-598) TaxID=741705 RepID=A0A5M3MH04_CONPW|nr:uncharacterized protein CONPUDRAFT_157070 [Coniophora puteana RWD-64-598 SS2]EIW77891.1 hypothetical protein CONPUDRAFT_157070 [Coniophora puteana RWD-64-598 SS2]